jgi:hemoglobin-like flavoprotein
MTEKQIKLIEESWDYIIMNTDEAGELFYGRLFDKHPELKPLFKSNPQEQARKLIALITFAVNKLNSFEEIISDVEALGKRHVAYGVHPKHYEIVGDTLLWTLEQGLGEKWNGDLLVAWSNLYGILSDIMIKAAQKHQSASHTEAV